MTVETLLADYACPRHAADIVSLLDLYARDPMGGGEPLPDKAKDRLVAELAAFPTAFTVLAYVDGQAAGLANCFKGFSTFYCRPLVNIHDLAVAPAFRGAGVSYRLLEKVERLAREQGCCKLTLEVLQGNRVARRAYQRFGFAPYRLQPELGEALFMQRLL